MEDGALRQWLLNLIITHGEKISKGYRWRLNYEEWQLLSKSVSRIVKGKARRAYIAYQVQGQAIVLGIVNGKHWSLECMKILIMMSTILRGEDLMVLSFCKVVEIGDIQIYVRIVIDEIRGRMEITWDGGYPTLH